MEDALETRDTLPAPLRVLLQDYPREAWDADPNFSQLIQFWLDRHLMFRRIMEAMQSETQRALDGDNEPVIYASRLSRYGSRFLGDLHGHHQIEDLHYFPRLKLLDQRISRGFDILDRDHHAIDGHLTVFAEEANAVLRAIRAGEDASAAEGVFLSGLERMEKFLNRHLTDEEELVVPVLLRHTPAGLT